jgi:hypothetical protein
MPAAFPRRLPARIRAARPMARGLLRLESPGRVAPAIGGGMSEETLWVLAGVGILIVIGLAVSVARRRRQRLLQQQFGPEYERAVAEEGPRRAERDLIERQRRVAKLELHDIPAPRLEELRREWRQLEADFVHHPGQAVAAAGELVTRALAERGYPVRHVEEHPEDLAVEHAQVLDDYRQAGQLAELARAGGATTEEMRQALLHYRALFGNVVPLGDDAHRVA